MWDTKRTLVTFADTGDGVVIMTNSDVLLAAGNALLSRVAEVYGLELRGTTRSMSHAEWIVMT